MTSKIKGEMKCLGMAAGLLVVTGMPSYGVDGVIEINQARAEAGDVTPGDIPGFPVTISEPGSYRLTGNLTVPDADTTAISITEADVTLDLNGFAILGPTTCSGSPTSCSSTGVGKGITQNSTGNVAVVNGTVTGMGSEGIDIPWRARVENVRSISNGLGGIVVGSGSTVVGSWALSNGGDGIRSAGGRTIVSGSTASSNAGDGIFVWENSVVTGNIVDRNGGDGIFAAAGGMVANNTLRSNGGDGITAGVGSSVVGNSLVDHSGGLALNSGSGGSAAGFANNVVWGGDVIISSHMGCNVVNGVLICPQP